MITAQTFRRTLPFGISSAPSHSPQLSRVFAAAVVDKQFCSMLLQDPQRAIDNGYLGAGFGLAHEERDLIVSIRANSLAELARQVTRALAIEP